MNKKVACRTKISIAVSVALGAGLLSAGFAPLALAQQTLERVEITGSAVKRIESEGALPVQILDRSDIDRSGVKSVTELLQSLPTLQGFSVTSQAVGGGGGGFAGASLHNVGEARTLILLNGRRLATWAGQTLTGAGAAIDLNSIPLAAVERVELLTDGASALYGADAVGGVINFILRTNKTDGDVSYNQSIPTGGVGRQINFSIAKGWGDLQKDGYNAMLVYSKDTQHSMKSTDRDFAKSGVIRFSQGGQNYVFFNGSSRTAPATWDVYDAAGNELGIGNIPPMGVGGACPSAHVFRGGRCRFDYTSTIQIFPENERDNLIGSFSKKLGQNHTFSADLVYSKFSLTSRIAPPPVDMLIPQGSAVYNTYIINPAIAATGALPGDDLFAYWRGVDVGNRTTQDETRAWHGTLAMKGLMAGWDYALAYTHSTNTWKESYKSGWLSLNELNAAIAAASFDPFLAPGLQSAAGNAALAGMQFKGEYKRETSTLDSLSLQGSRDVFKIGEQTASLGAGINFNREKVKYEPSALAQGQGNSIAGDSASEVPFDVSRRNWGAFAELVTPFSKTVELTSSVRHDQYQEIGSTDNYKFAGRYQPNKAFLVRGSVGSGFRAPSVPQVKASRQQYGVTGGTYGCPAAALAAQQLIDPTVICRVDQSQYDQFASGNPTLKPEKSQQWTLGFRAEPVEWASIGVDYWNIYLKDTIGQLAEDVVMRNPAQYLKNFTIFNDPGTGNHYVALFLPNENLGNTKAAGIDVDGRLQFNTGIGKLSTTFRWTHMLKYTYQRIKNGDWYSNLGYYNDDSVTFKDIWNLAFNLKQGPWQHTLTFKYKSSYRDYQCTAADCALVRIANPNGTIGGLVDMTDHTVKSWQTADWQTQYEFRKMLTLTVGILNISDTAPPLSIRVSGPHQLGYDPRYTDPRGRTVYGSLTYKF